MSKKILLILLIALTLVGCSKKRSDDNYEVGDPNTTYTSTYNGEYGTTGKLEGNTVIVSIITDDATTSWSDSSTDKKTLKTIIDKLETSAKYLTKQAAKYNKTVTFVYNWEKYTDLKYTATFTEDLITKESTYYDLQKQWIKNNIDSTSIKNKYHADNIIYMFYLNTDFKNTVKPWTMTHNNCSKCDVEFSNIFYRYDSYAAPAGTIAHEMLHQFGAPDFYYKNDFIPQNYVDYLTNNDTKDIMFYINKGTAIESEFTSLDAYYVGIGSRPSVADEWNLGKNEYGY